MLTGAASAQVAILVVSCVDRIKEQTRRHSFLINMLGIKDIIVAINKMDLVDYDESVFNRTKEKVSQMLASLGYNQCQFIPVSATEGDNVYQPSFLTAWYRGSTLIKALDNLESATVIDKPLRFVVQGAYSVNGEEITMGIVESGVLRKGERLLFQPSGISATVCSIRVFPGELNEARAGDSIGVINDRDVLRGDVGGHINEPPSVATDFLGKVVLLEGTLHKHDELEIRCGTKKVQCKVKEIRERISSETGEVISRNAREIKENEAAVAVFHTEPIVIEKFSEIPELGRFILVRDGKNIGAGIILER
jgi:elongation factor 1-alpha